MWMNTWSDAKSNRLHSSNFSVTFRRLSPVTVISYIFQLGNCNCNQLRFFSNMHKSACEAEASVNTIQHDVLLSCSAFSKGDQLKKGSKPDGQTYSWAVRTAMTSFVPNFKARITNALWFTNPNAELISERGNCFRRGIRGGNQPRQTKLITAMHSIECGSSTKWCLPTF